MSAIAMSGRWVGCKIKRTMKVGHYSLNIVTGKKTRGKSEIVTQRCGVPLFSPEEEASGICRSCHQGWSVKDNKFANERERATALAGKPCKPPMRFIYTDGGSHD